MVRNRIAACVAGALVGLSANAGVVPIGEFFGEQSEGFEAILPPGGYPGPMPIFGGNGSLTDTVANFCVIALSWFGPAGEILPYNGNFMGGTVAGASLFEFSVPVRQFGGFFNTIGTLPNGTVTFRDTNGVEIATLPFNVTPLEWGWQGWQSTTLIGSVEITGANVPGIGMQFDDLHISSVPAPGAAVMLLMGGVLVRRRRA